jgi:hypothetical protein
LDEKARRDIIIKFIENKPGCTAEDIVEGIKNEISRQPVFDLLKDLLNEKIIVDNKINRRDHRYFINNNNILYNTKKEIEKFKLAYFHLLAQYRLVYDNEYKINTNNKNKFTNINSKNSDIDISFLLKKISESKEADDIYDKRYNLIVNNQERIGKLHKLLKSYKTDTNIFLLHRSQVTILKKERKIFLSEYNEIKNLLNAYYSKVKRIGSIGILIWSIYIFYLFVELIHIKNILIIPYTITNKEILLKVNQIIHSEILEINMTLAEFNTIFRNSENGRDFISFFSLFPTYYDEKFVSQLIHDHIAMNMTSEIKVVMDSLEDICINIRKSGAFLPRYYYINEQLIESCYDLLQNIKEI